MGNQEPTLDRERATERRCDRTEQQYAKRRERCLRGCCGTRVCSVLGGLVSRVRFSFACASSNFLAASSWLIFIWAAMMLTIRSFAAAASGPPPP